MSETTPAADERDDPPGTDDPPSEISGWRRLLRSLVLVALLVAALATTFVAWALRTDSGRAFVLRQVEERTLAASGWQLRADDFDLAISPARLEVRGLTFGAPDGPPLLDLDEGTVDFRWSALRQETPVFDRAHLRGLVLDLSAPTPPGRDDPDDEEDDDAVVLPVSFPDVMIDGGRVIGGPVGTGDGGGGWIRAWQVDHIRIDGAVAASGFEGRVDRARVRVERQDPPDGPNVPDDGKAETLVYDLAGQVRGPYLGPYTVERVDLHGNGLELRGSATAGLEDDEPLAADFQLLADAERLLPRLPTISAPPSEIVPSQQAGTLRVGGRFDFRRLRGTLDLDAEEVPARLFEPLVGGEMLDRLAAHGTTLDADGRVDLDLAAPEASTGQVELRWRRNGDDLLTATLRVDETASGSPPDAVRVAVEARLLPGLAGRRHVEGKLRAPAWDGLAALRVESARVNLELPDLPHLRRELARRWPGLSSAGADASMPPAVESVLWQGALTARADLSGSLRSPRTDLDATWRPASGSTLRVQFSGRPVALQGQTTLVAESFALRTLAPLLAPPPAPPQPGKEPNEDPDGVPDGDPEKDAAEQDVPAPPALLGTLDGRLDVTFAEAIRLVGDLGVRDLELQTGAAGQGRLTASRIATDGEVEIRIDPASDLPAALERATVGDVLADLRLEVEDLVTDTSVDAGPRLLGLEADVRLADARLDLRRVEAQIQFPGGGRVVPFDADGFLGLVADQPLRRPLVRNGELRLATNRPDERVERAEVELRLEEGILFADLVDLELPAPAPDIQLLAATLPLESLHRAPGLGEIVGSLPVADKAQGPVTVAFELPGFDSMALYRWLALEPPAETFRADLEGAFRFDPADPTGGDGNVELREVVIELTEHTFESAETQRLQLVDRKLWLRRARWQARDRFFDAEAEVFLDSSWQLSDPPGGIVDSFSAIATGSLQASLLNGYIAGGRAEGLVDVTALAAGTPDEFDAEIDLVGNDDTTFSWIDPYPTFVRSPEVRLVIDDEEIRIEKASADLNEGRLDVDGTVQIDGPWNLRGYLDRVRYRLEYGLTVLVSGNVDLHLPTDGPGLLQSNLLVERGFLRRHIDPDREVLSFLLQPPEIDVQEASDELQQMRLAIDIATVDGVRVKNNVADFHVSWAPLEVSGTLAQPSVRGSVEADPGGKVYAWGQVIRLDRAALQFQGTNPARLDLVTTSSVQDPSIARGGDSLLAGATSRPALFDDGRTQQETGSSIASGLTTYYGDQLVSRLGQSLLGTRVEYRPVLLFGEANPEAKLVVSQDLSQHIGLAVAFDLSESDERIYLIDLHGFSILPSLSGTFFSDSDSDYGATVQQQFDFGGGTPAEDEDLPLLDDVVVRCDTCAKGGGRHELVDLGDIRRAVGYREDDPIASGTDFDVEVEVAAMLRDRGFPDPHVEADVEPDSDAGFVDILVSVEPGPYAEFRFTGEAPPKRRRESIRSLYRIDYYESASIEEVKERTLRVWQAEGHPEPMISVDVEHEDPDDPRSDRTVTVHSEPGRALEIQQIRLRTTEGDLDEELARNLRSPFDSVIWRVRLAVADESADRRLREALASFGYPRAQVTDHELRDDDEVIVVTVDLGPRQTLGDVTIQGLEGLDDEIARSARESVELAAGDPQVSPRIAGAAVDLERHLRSRGFYEARVHSKVEPLAEDAVMRSSVKFIVEPGDRFVLHAIEIRGADTTDHDWMREIAGLEPGAPLDRGKVADARRELIQTGLFERVLVEVERREEGAVLVFDVVERHRWDLGYGLRWTGEGNAGVVGDVVDRNVAGRGVELGLRVLLGTEESRARLYSSVPRLFDRNVKLELFAEYFEDTTRDVEENGWLVSSQLSAPLLPNLEGRVYTRFRDDTIRDPTNPEDPEIEERTPLAGIQLVWDSRDSPLDPQRGFLASIDLSGSSDVLGGDRTYRRLFTQVKAFVPFAERYDGTAWVWAQSLRLGLADADDGLPALVRFFAGGPLSVRGYRERNLGPQFLLSDGTSVARGGQASFILNEELRFPLPWIEGYQGVVFFDAGQVWAEPEDVRLQDLVTSTGFGVRGNTPIGLLRLDVAFPLDRRPQDDSVEFYFGFGHSF